MVRDNYPSSKDHLRGEYLVLLPDALYDSWGKEINVNGYKDFKGLPRIGITTASSPQKAIANHLFKYKPEIGKVVLNILHQLEKGGIENCALKISELHKYSKLVNGEENKSFKSSLPENYVILLYNISKKLAEVNYSDNPLDYAIRAGDILNKLGK